MNIVMKKTTDLIEYENNPRNNESAVDAVYNSIKEFGFKVPIVITSDNVIIAGHTRLKASIKLGLDKVPCIIADDLTEDQIKAYRLVDNKTAEFATWDLEKLEEELLNIDMSLLDFGFEDFDGDIPDNAIDDDFDPLDELPEEPVSQRGDIFVLGKHRVMCGDSTIESDVKKLVNNEVIDMVFTDPPYNVDYEGTAGKIQNDKMDNNSFYEFLFKAFSNMSESIKKGGSIYVCHADTEGINFRNAFTNAGFKQASTLIWVKNSLVLGRQDYHWRHEPILYGWKEGAAHYFIDDRTQDTIWEYNKPRRNEEHPTMKPLELVGRAISNSSKPNELVLDLFGGSGSTLIAADQLKRTAYIMELDEKFVDVIIKRFIRHNENINDEYYRIRDGEKTLLKDIEEYFN
jgi:DNA modification methylase